MATLTPEDLEMHAALVQGDLRVQKECAGGIANGQFLKMLYSLRCCYDVPDASISMERVRTAMSQ